MFDDVTFPTMSSSVRLKFLSYSFLSVAFSHSYIACFTETVIQWWYCESYAALSTMCVAHSALLTYNAALNRPAYQSSVWVNSYGSFNASLANDGSHETNATKDDKPRCSISRRETNPWWAVDLGGPTEIYRVDLTNRADDGGVYLVCLEFRKVHLSK